MGAYSGASIPCPQSDAPPLTDLALRRAKPAEKTQKLFDGGGLYLEISPKDGRWWRLKYRFDGKEKRLALGVYPDVPLALARQRREDARQMLARGIDPGEHRKAVAQAKAELGANTFEVIAREWLGKRDWVPKYSVKVLAWMENDVPVDRIQTSRRADRPRVAAGCATHRSPGRDQICPPDHAELRPDHAVCDRHRARRAQSRR